MRGLIRILIRAYRWGVSPFLPAHCRFYPTCSAYALEAIEKYPLKQAVMLSLRRVGRCHPWHPGGYDPLPHHQSNADGRPADSH